MKLFVLSIILVLSVTMARANESVSKAFSLHPGDALKVTVEPIIPGRPGFRVSLLLNDQKAREYASFVRANANSEFLVIVTDLHQGKLLQAYTVNPAWHAAGTTLAVTYPDLRSALDDTHSFLAASGH